MRRLFLIFMIASMPFIYSQTTAMDQAPGPEGTDNLPKPIVTDDYVLMPGDSLLVTITGATNYSYIAAVTFEGKITLNMPVTTMLTMQGTYVPQYDVVAAVPIYGLSLRIAKDSLKRAFSKYLRNISVDLTLIGMRTFDVMVVGEVNNPGIVRALPISRVSTVIDAAGGINAIGSRVRIELKRGYKYYATVNLMEFDQTGDPRMNPFVHDGDIVVIPEMEQSVVVKGAVFGKREYELRVAELTAAREKSSEGLYELIEGDRVADLITRAGGLTPWSDPKNAYIERNDEKLYIDLSTIIAEPDSPQNISMMNGDVLIVPSVNSVVYVQGQVANPGPYPFQPQLHAHDYIGVAGGPLSDANTSGAYVKRGTQRIPVRSNPLVEEGDLIHVPRQVFKFWQDYLEIGAVVASLLISYLTLTK